MMKRMLVVGGANGIGLSIAQELAHRESTKKVRVVDKRFYQKLEGEKDFYYGVMDSIAGWMSSSFFCCSCCNKGCIEVFFSLKGLLKQERFLIIR